MNPQKHMKRSEFIELVGTAPKSTREAVRLADERGIIFHRRNAHLKAWFGKGKDLLPSKHNIIG